MKNKIIKFNEKFFKFNEQTGAPFHYKINLSKEGLLNLVLWVIGIVWGIIMFPRVIITKRGK